jgi:hypothetical protein
VTAADEGKLRLRLRYLLWFTCLKPDREEKVGSTVLSYSGGQYFFLKDYPLEVCYEGICRSPSVGIHPRRRVTNTLMKTCPAWQQTYSDQFNCCPRYGSRLAAKVRDERKHPHCARRIPKKARVCRALRTGRRAALFRLGRKASSAVLLLKVRGTYYYTGVKFR